MSDDARLVLLLGALHVLGFGLGAGLLLLALRTDERPPPSGGTSGGDGGGPTVPPRPSLGPPLPDARPARVRLRDHRRPGGRATRAPRRRSPGDPPRIPAPP